MDQPGFRAELPEPIIHAYGRGRGMMQLAVVIELSRPLTFEQLSRAVSGLVSSFPILACCYAPGQWRDRWEPLPEFPLEKAVVVEDADDSLEEKENRHLSSFLDCEQGWPLKVVALNHAHGSRLLIIYPHLLGDANAGLSLAWALGKWLYGPGLPAAIPMDRGIMQLWRALGLRSLPALMGELLREAGKIFYLPFVGAWSRGFSPTPELSGKMTYGKIFLKGPAHDNFVAVCKRNNATINDGLAAVSALTASRRSSAKFFGTLYTVNLRRYLENPGPIIANFSGINTLTLSRKFTGRLDRMIAAVADRTGGHKRRLPGIAFSLLPVLFFWWLPSGPMHGFGTRIFSRIAVGQGRRFAVFTNAGAMDSFLEPFGKDALDAYMIGPFQRGFQVPIVIASGFRERLAVCVCAADDITRESVEALVSDWREILASFDR